LKQIQGDRAHFGLHIAHLQGSAEALARAFSKHAAVRKGHQSWQSLPRRDPFRQMIGAKSVLIVLGSSKM
jgi:hypothetical protein